MWICIPLVLVDGGLGFSLVVKFRWLSCWRRNPSEKNKMVAGKSSVRTVLFRIRMFLCVLKFSAWSVFLVV